MNWYVIDQHPSCSAIINSLSTSLRIEFPDATGFSPRNLSRMKKFYETYKDLSNFPTALAKLPWTHNSILVERISDVQRLLDFLFHFYDKRDQIH